MQRVHSAAPTRTSVIVGREPNGRQKRHILAECVPVSCSKHFRNGSVFNYCNNSMKWELFLPSFPSPGAEA